MKKIAMLVAVMACVMGEGQALNCGMAEGNLAITGGYRNDRITTDVSVFDLSDTLFLQDNLKGTDIDIYQIGLQGSLLYCRKWLIRGYVDCGEVCSGKYKEIVFTDDASSPSKGKITKGNSYDTSVGLGYLFPFGNCISVGPVAGYSYSKLKIKMPKISTGGFDDDVLSGLHYSMRWQGPWLGADAVYRLHCFKLGIGYEYHWSHWHADWTLAGPDVAVAFSDKRKTDHSCGNVIFINGTYTFFKCWNAGLGFKYQYWKARDGRVVPQSEETASQEFFQNEISKVPSATWRSYQIEISLGYVF